MCMCIYIYIISMTNCSNVERCIDWFMYHLIISMYLVIDLFMYFSFFFVSVRLDQKRDRLQNNALKKTK